MRAAALPGGIGVSLLVAAALSLASTSHAQVTHDVAIGDIWFCDSTFANGVCVTEVNAGDTIVWTDTGDLTHTVTGDNFPEGFDSGILNPGETFSQVYTLPGEYEYGCTVHPGQMAGLVRVFGLPAGEETPTPTPEVTPAPDDATPTPAPTPAAPPPTGGPPSAAASHWLAALALASGAALLAAAGLGLKAVRHK